MHPIGKSRRIIPTITGVLLLGACGASPDSPDSSAARPNAVIILADDQGWGDLSVHGNTNPATPNIDSLARDGALLKGRGELTLQATDIPGAQVMEVHSILLTRL